MLTQEFLKENFITAHFVDNARTQIEVVTASETKGEIDTTIIEYDLEHPWCQMLLEVIDLDTLHENTWTKINEERKEFRKVAMAIAEEDGIIAEMKKNVSLSALELLNKFIFKFEESFPTTKTEELFNFKLWLFDIEEVKNCKDDDLKSRLRKAKTPKEALQIVFEIK